MAQQNGLPGPNPAAPPFATKEGLPAVRDGQGMGAAMPKDRPQSEAQPEVVPSTAEQPAKGGVVLLADPSGTAGDSGAVVGAGGAREVPFKSLR